MKGRAGAGGPGRNKRAGPELTKLALPRELVVGQQAGPVPLPAEEDGQE